MSVRETVKMLIYGCFESKHFPLSLVVISAARVSAVEGTLSATNLHNELWKLRSVNTEGTHTHTHTHACTHKNVEMMMMSDNIT